MNISSIFLIFIACLLNSSCATAKNKAEQPFIWLTNDTKFILLPAHNIEKPLDGMQRISALFGGDEYIINTWVKADKNGMDITLLNEMGAGIGELLYSNGKVKFSSAVFPSNLTPEYIIADFQFCFYSADALLKSLEKTGFDFSENKKGSGKSRLIMKDKKTIIEINYNLNYIRLNNHLRGYSYTLQGEF